MTLCLETRTYQLADGHEITIQFFANAERFKHLLRDHLLGVDEGAKTPAEPWERPLSRRFLKKLCQELPSVTVSSREASILAEAYREVIPVLDEGIAFSIQFPIYVAFQQERKRLRESESYRTDGYYFLTWDGYLIVVRDSVVRTAYFRCATIKPVGGRRELVYEAWKYLKNLGNSWTTDVKGGEHYKHAGLKHVSPENWSNAEKVLKQWPTKRRMTS